MKCVLIKNINSSAKCYCTPALPSLNVRAGSFWTVSQTRYETNCVSYVVRNIQSVYCI